MSSIDIEITNRCNAKCHFCPRDATPHQGLMTTEVFDQTRLVVKGRQRFAIAADGRVLLDEPAQGVDLVGLLHAFGDAHPLTPLGVKEALERVKMIPAASGSPGTYLSFGKWTRRGWMGAGYLVARQLDPDGVSSHLVGRFGDR